MTITFSVTNFDKHQHYRDRMPPWIKLYNELLDDYTFGKLPDAAKAHLIAIWLLASRSDNAMPLDGDWVARRINATGAVDLQVLLDAGFLVVNDPASKAPEKRKQKACPEREGEKETEREEKYLSDSPVANADPCDVFSQKGEEPRSEGQTGTGGESGEDQEPDTADPPPPKRSANYRKTYPPEFETFWAGYPLDPIMSKTRAFARWQTLSRDDRARAIAALPSFRQHCVRNPTYRAVHAERFLSQRRFDGFLAPQPEVPRVVADARALWGGAAAPLVDEIGAPSFLAYFGAAKFDPGPPARIAVAKLHIRDLIREKYSAALGRALGTFELVETLHANTHAPPSRDAPTPVCADA